MNILVTAGNTLVPIDRVRCLTNIFTGRTGTAIALHCHAQGHQVTLLTSHPAVVEDMGRSHQDGRFLVHRYSTFDDLERLLK